MLRRLLKNITTNKQALTFSKQFGYDECIFLDLIEFWEIMVSEIKTDKEYFNARLGQFKNLDAVRKYVIKKTKEVE
jgi:hypothetical protein